MALRLLGAETVGDRAVRLLRAGMTRTSPLLRGAHVVRVAHFRPRGGPGRRPHLKDGESH